MKILFVKKYHVRIRNKNIHCFIGHVKSCFILVSQDLNHKSDKNPDFEVKSLNSGAISQNKKLRQCPMLKTTKDLLKDTKFTDSLHQKAVSVSL
jgi:hypothetical protein